MGYYTGSGVVTGGSDVENVKETVYWVTQHTIYQRVVTTNTVKNGVSLATAQAAQGSANIVAKKFTQSGTGSWIVSLGADGTSASANYSRVGDSNLYALAVTSTTYTTRDSAGWTKGDV